MSIDPSDVRDAAVRASDHPWVDTLARAGFVVNGLVHALIAWLALRLAWGAHGESVDQAGALEQLGRSPGGALILWGCAIGLTALALVMLISAVGYGAELTDRIKGGAKAGGGGAAAAFMAGFGMPARNPFA